MRSKLVLLSSINNPLRYIFVNTLTNYVALGDVLLILDEKGLRPEDLTRFKSRFGIKYEHNKKISSNIRTELVNSHNDEKTIELVEAFNPHYIVNAGTPRKLNQKIVSKPKIATLNVHPGRLPAYRGCTAVEWALHFGDTPTNTLHVMDGDYDSGDILVEEQYNKNAFSSYVEIRRHMYQRAPEMVGNFVNSVRSKAQFERMRHVQDEETAIYRHPISDRELQLVINGFGENHET